MPKGPFDISKIIFESPNKWDEVTKRDKIKNFFILNQRFAINYPLQANLLSHIKINTEHVVDFWKTFLSSKYKKTPYWMYTKGKKKQEEQKQKKTKINKKTVSEYAKYYNFDIHSVRDAIEIFPDDMKKELNKFEKMSK